MTIYDLWLCNSKIQPQNKLLLYKEFKDTKNLWYYIFKNNNNNYINSRIRNTLIESFDEDKLNNILNYIKENELKYVFFNDEFYPEKLKNYDDAPFMLFYNGDLEKLNKNKSAAVVGSRNCTLYGRNAAAMIAKELGSNGINIISGLAKGIDAISHKACLDGKGFTCAVLGCGIDVIYPKQNSSLYYDIVKNGCIISEYIPHTEPEGCHFPIRNRIISALSDVVIIVEAADRSGSLITAHLASDQGKEVMVVPGSIFSRTSAGTNKLIKDGAEPVTSIEDIFTVLGIESIKPKQDDFNIYEKVIFKIVKDTPVHIDDIIRSTNIDIEHLYALLFELQLKDEILCLAGNYYVRSANAF